MANEYFAEMYAVAGDFENTVRQFDRAIYAREAVIAIHSWPDFAKWQDTPEFPPFEKAREFRLVNRSIGRPALTVLDSNVRSPLDGVTRRGHGL